MKRAIALVALLLAGCADAPQPRSLSTGEAERLALVRFTNYTAKSAKFLADIPSPGGKLLLTGRVDFVDHLGYAAMRTEGRDDPASAGLLQWNLSRLAYLTNPATEPVDPPPDGDWQIRPFQEAGSEIDGALRLLVNLAADRPDNAQLLQQSSARWLRKDNVGGVGVDVLEGPQQAGKTPSADGARVRYWVDADGRLKRIEARLGDQREFAKFDILGTAPAVAVIPPLAP
ncbi:hypothetical protein SAMN05421504_102282 [Amycolatopsis xylanica]|uniref:Lipoprotein LprG n=1 Tax=Amycolatopsis xylanica TaxID=589385 RepID=A0A1H2YWQ7_9PSEU|nr:hypothetical protein [Amycolatopsis xylanica]SDX09178.1 hypothetical protein SAMN05421504_102282 [Amycolatopsis xylanica]